MPQNPWDQFAIAEDNLGDTGMSWDSFSLATSTPTYEETLARANAQSDTYDSLRADRMAGVQQLAPVQQPASEFNFNRNDMRDALPEYYLPAEAEKPAPTSSFTQLDEAFQGARSELRATKNQFGSGELYKQVVSPLEDLLQKNPKKWTLEDTETWNQQFGMLAMAAPKPERGIPDPFAELRRFDSLIPKPQNTAPESYFDPNTAQIVAGSESFSDNPLTRPIASGVGQAAMGMLSTVARPFSDEKADEFNRMGDVFRQSADFKAKKSDQAGLLDTAMGDMSSSLFQMLTLRKAGLGAYGIIGSQATIAANQALTKAHDAGLEGEAAYKYAAEQGAIEGVITAAFQKVGLGGVEQAATEPLKAGLREGLREAIKSAPKRILSENVEELSIALASKLKDVEHGVDANALDPERLKADGLRVALATTLTMGTVDASRVTASAFTSPQEAAQQVLQNPEAAAKLAESNGSRSAVADALGLDRNDLKLSAEDRQKTVQTVKETLEGIREDARSFYGKNPEHARNLLAELNDVKAGDWTPKQFEVLVNQGQPAPFPGYHQLFLDYLKKSVAKNPDLAIPADPTAEPVAFPDEEGELVDPLGQTRITGDDTPVERTPTQPAGLTPAPALEQTAITPVGETPPVEVAPRQMTPAELRSQLEADPANDAARAELKRRGYKAPAADISIQPWAKTPEEFNQKTWYHGTGAEDLSASRLDPTMTKEDNLFGMGVYLTDAPSIAEGYAKSRGKRKPGTVYKASLNVGNVLDLEQPAQPELVDVLRKHAWGQHHRTPDARVLDAINEAAAKPGATLESVWDAMGDAMTDISQAEGIPTAEFGESMQLVSEDLRKLGYDALTHTGGKRTNKPPHQVVILLDPNDTAEATGRKGLVKSFDRLEAPQKPAEAPPASETPIESSETPVAPQTAAETPQKQPWEMTRGEFANQSGAVFHGTDADDFSDFRDSRIGSATDEGWLGRGHYFSTDREGMSQRRRTLIPATIGLENPLRVSLPDFRTDKSKVVNDALGTKGLRGQALTDELKRQGYDGVSLDYSPTGYKHVEHVVFDPSKIDTHRKHVQAAVAEGKPVPAEVLTDYPDLQPEFTLKRESTQGTKPVENIRGEQGKMFPGERAQENLPGQREMFDEFTGETRPEAVVGESDSGPRRKALATWAKRDKIASLPLWHWDYGDSDFVINIGGDGSQRQLFKGALENALGREVQAWREGWKLTRSEADSLGLRVSKQRDGQPLSAFLRKPSVGEPTQVQSPELREAGTLPSGGETQGTNHTGGVPYDNRTKGQSPKREVRTAKQTIAEVAAERSLDEQALKEAVDYLHEFETAGLQDFDDPLKQWFRKSGINAGMLDKVEDPDGLPRFDELADEFLGQHPGYAKDAGELFELLKKGKFSAPRKSDPEFVKRAADFLESGSREPGDETSESMDSRFGESGRQRQTPELVSETPFAAHPGVSLEQVGKELKAGLRGMKGTLRRYFTSRGDLPTEVFDEKVARDGSVSATMKQVAFTQRDFNKALGEAYGSRRNISDRQWGQIDAALKGDVAITDLPPALQPVVARMRSEVDALSRKLIDVGAVDGELEATIRGNLGAYLHRSYRVFDDPNWAKKISPTVRNQAKALIRSEYPDYSDNQVSQVINALLYEGKAAESPLALLKNSKLGSKDLGILNRRKDIPVEIRALFGEYKDPDVNYVRSVTKIANLIANHQFLENVKEQGLGKFFWTGEEANIDPKAKVKIAAEASEVMHPLNGLYTTPEIKDAFDKQFAPKTQNPIFAAYMAANGLTKYGKTIISHVTHFRNFMSNATIVTAQGHWQLGKLDDAVKATWTDLTSKDDSQWREYVKKLTKLGVVGESVHGGELKDVIRDATITELDEIVGKSASRVLKSAASIPRKLYESEDNFWKVYAFENEKSRYQAAHPGWSESKVEAKAAEIVRNTMPTYSLVPEAVKTLRRIPVVGTFVSFPAEVIRTGYNTLELIQTELSDPKTRAIGAQRLAGTVAALSWTAAVAGLSRWLIGMGKDDEDDLREFVAPWSANSQFVHLPPDESGKKRYMDLGYSDPYAYLKKPVTALMRGDDWKDGLWDAVKELGSPFFSEEILAGKLLDVSRNKKKENGRPVYNEQDSAENRTRAIVNHVYEAFEPGSITSLKRLGKSLDERTAEEGKSYDPVLETGAQFGFRVSEVDVEQSLSFQAQGFVDQMGDANRILNSTAMRRGRVEDDEIRNAYESSDTSRRKLFDKMHERIHAAIRLGVPSSKVMETLKDAGISQTQIDNLVAGNYDTYLPTTLDDKPERKALVEQLAIERADDSEVKSAAIREEKDREARNHLYLLTSDETLDRKRYATDEKFQTAQENRNRQQREARLYVEKAGLTFDAAKEQLRLAYNKHTGRKPEHKPPVVEYLKTKETWVTTPYGKRVKALRSMFPEE